MLDTLNSPGVKAHDVPQHWDQHTDRHITGVSQARNCLPFISSCNKIQCQSYFYFFKLNKILIILFFSVIWDVHLSEYSTQREQCKLLTSIIYTSMVNTAPVSRDHLYFIFYKMTLVKDYYLSAIIHIYFV